MKTNIELEDGQKIWLATFTGQVMDSTKESETSIYSEVESVATTVGSVPFTTVHSEVDRTHTLWLRNQEGREEEVLLPDHSFSTRVGHVVTVLWGAADGYKGYYLGAVNHTTGGVWRKDLSFALTMARTDFGVTQNLHRGRSPRGWTPGVILLVTIIGIAAWFAFKAWDAALITALSCAVPLWFFRRWMANSMHFSLIAQSLQLLEAQIEKSMQGITSSGGINPAASSPEQSSPA